MKSPSCAITPSRWKTWIAAPDDLIRYHPGPEWCSLINRVHKGAFFCSFADKGDNHRFRIAGPMVQYTMLKRWFAVRSTDKGYVPVHLKKAFQAQTGVFISNTPGAAVLLRRVRNFRGAEGSGRYLCRKNALSPYASHRMTITAPLNGNPGAKSRQGSKQSRSTCRRPVRSGAITSLLAVVSSSETQNDPGHYLALPCPSQ